MFQLLSALIASLLDFIDKLFFSSSPKYQKKKALKSCAAELKQLQPPLYRSEKILLPAFASLLYQLYHLLQSVKSILEKTICAPDAPTAEKYQNMFFERKYTDEQKKQRSSFTFAERNIQLDKCKNYAQAEKKIQEQIIEFKNFIGFFQTESAKDDEKELTNLFFLFDLCTFDYEAFIKRFDRNVRLTPSEQTEAPQPKFEEVFAGDAVQNLLDFQFIIQHTTIDAAALEHILFLGGKAECIPDDTAAQNIRKTLQAVETILAQQLKRTSIPLMLKLIKDDPLFEEQITVSEERPLEEYLDRITAVFETDTKRLQKIYMDRAITEFIAHHFGAMNPKPLEGYNDAVNDAIRGLSIDAFEWVKPLFLLKAFTECCFEVRYKTFLQSVLIEGFFSNKQAEIKYSAAYRSCETLVGKFKAFEQLFNPKGQCDREEIELYVAEIKKGKDLRKSLRKIIDTANMQAKGIVQAASKMYIDLYVFIGHLLEDCKTSTPAFVTNIKTLATSSKNREAFANLERDRQLFAQFLDIMKNYAVPDADGKGKLQKAPQNTDNAKQQKSPAIPGKASEPPQTPAGEKRK